MNSTTEKTTYRAGDDPCPFVRNYAMFPEDPEYEKHVGESKNTWLVADVPNSGDRVYRTAKPDNSGGEGFGGATLLFKCKDGDQFALKGGWHANSMDLYKDTRIDTRDKHSTKCTVGEAVHAGHFMAVENLLYTEAWQVGPYLRGDFMVQRLANKLKKRLYGIIEGMGGAHQTAASPVFAVTDKDVVNPDNDLRKILESFASTFLNSDKQYYKAFDDSNLPKTIAGLIATCWANKETKEQIAFTKAGAFEFVTLMINQLAQAGKTGISVVPLDFDEAKYNKKSEANTIEKSIFGDNKNWIFVDVPCFVCMTAEALTNGKPVDQLFIDCRCVFHDDRL